MVAAGWTAFVGAVLGVGEDVGLVAGARWSAVGRLGGSVGLAWLWARARELVGAVRFDVAVVAGRGLSEIGHACAVLRQKLALGSWT